MESLPFPRGSTAFGGTPDNSTYGNHLLGQEFCQVDTIYGTGRFVWLRAVRNLIGTPKPAVFAKTLAIMDPTGTTITGVTNLDAQGAGGVTGEYGPIAPVDELLTSAGCAYQDICYVVVEGPALCLTAMSNTADNVINVGDWVNAQTYNTTTGAVTTGGRIKTRLLTSSVTVQTTESEGVFGRAMSSIATSGQTNTGVLVDVFRRL
jgi:hypothetical protein